MYVNISIQIRIGSLVIDTVEAIEVENTLNSLIDSAQIVLPREFKLNSQTDFRNRHLLDFIEKDMPVEISFGYNNNLVKEYEGYVTSIGAEIPVVIRCEDEMSKLKKSGKFNLSFETVSLENLLKKIAPGYELDCLDITLGKLSIENATAFEVLEDLRKFGIKCWFSGKTLRAGLPLKLANQEKHLFEFGKNIRQSSDLEYVSKDKKELKIKAISIQKGTSKKLTYEFGENVNGERTLHAPLNLSQSELKTWAEDYYNNIVFDGYEGSVDGWCIPRTKAGETLSLKDPNYPEGERDGNFLIEEVITQIDSQVGIRRRNKISLKL